MKTTRLISSWRIPFKDSPRERPVAHEPPLRAEVYSVEQLTRHAKWLAGEHRVTTRRGANQLLARLARNEKILRAYNSATIAAARNRPITPAAEWLLDNFYLIEEQIQLARRHLPRHYSRELPRLQTGSSAGLPRVYDLALELIRHVDAQLDSERLSAFVAAYQEVSPLKLGELWAIPIMLRLALIENLRRVTVALSAARRSRDRADYWTGRLQRVLETEPSNLVVVVAELAKSRADMNSAFVTELCQRLSRMHPAVHLARHWIEQHLAERNLSVERLMQVDSQNQASDQVSVSHSISGLRFFGAMNWREFVETMSVVDQTLRHDPSGVYGSMDFQTRDHYRHCVERLARYSGLTEVEVAQQAVKAAEEDARLKGRDDRRAHVGFHLIDRGANELGEDLDVRWPWRDRIERSLRAMPLVFYLGTVTLVAVILTLMIMTLLAALHVNPLAMAFLAIFALLGWSQAGVALVNALSSLLVGPRMLPRLDFSDGIPPDCRTMVVVPTMLTDSETISRLIERLEIHYLANRDSNLLFALLTDFRDAPSAKMPEDQALLQQACEGIDALNEKYRKDERSIFYLFHRPRLWSPSEGVWMGYERKRGKLADFDAALRGRGLDRFEVIIGGRSILRSIKFVITLDADTELPRDAARRMVGVMAHPLNLPRMNVEHGIVEEGYGILQPRVDITLASARRSWMARLYASEPGIDPYTRAVSDVYQDLFDEGSFIGKGIYHVDAFTESLDNRFPENTILSHDLIESVYARSGLVSDISLYEDFPSNYIVDVNRRHRWVRGDWQIAPWLLPRVPTAEGTRKVNHLSGLSRWKIFDNLRRSLVPPALVLFLVGTWIFVPSSPFLGLACILAVIALPQLLSILAEVSLKSSESTWRGYLGNALSSLGRHLAQIGLQLAFLPYEAYANADAICRTMYRVLITRRRLLEWQTARDAELTARSDLSGIYLIMAAAPVLGLGTAAWWLVLQPSFLWIFAPLSALWLATPGLAWWISRPIQPKTPVLTRRQISFLRQVARRTWRYFETFVSEEHHWLPPDNFQEHPHPVVAPRTSATNIGLSLLSHLAAHDFGYLSTDRLIQRIRGTFDTLDELERHNGHFFNWYDTRTLRPLPPHYVSTVDSGNLAGHLLTLASGLRELADVPILGLHVFEGLRDTLNIVRELAKPHPRLTELNRLLVNPPAAQRDRLLHLHEIAHKASTLANDLGGHDPELTWWCDAFSRNCRDHVRDADPLVSWMASTPHQDLEDLGQSRSATVRADRDQGRAQAGELTLRHLSDWNRTGVVSESPDRRVTGRSNGNGRVEPGWRRQMDQSIVRATERIHDLHALADRALAFAEMDFGFLFDKARKLFAIGYNASEHRRDDSYYDLLASEARLASFIAIMQGRIPQDHWFVMGRLLAPSRGAPVLVSWSGSMFEYLMPMLVMPSYEHTLLDESCRAAVQAHLEYGRMHRVPWGISESGYNATDINLNYQYRAFGVPGLGFKRGLAEDLVIAPYASAMALMLTPVEACFNLRRLADEGCQGRYGFYEAIDYTASRLPPGADRAVIRSFMAHHQGMSLLALNHLLMNRAMPRRFLAHPPSKSAVLLLQERVPTTAARARPADFDASQTRKQSDGAEGAPRIFTNPNAAAPQIHLLSNGRYHVVITAAGSGYSRWQDLAVTRWREDTTRDCWGSFCFLRDVDSADFWSTTHQPTLRSGRRYQAIFSQSRAEFRQRCGKLNVHTEITVSPEDDLELRRVTVTNHSRATRTIEFTSYAEIVLSPVGADMAHPAFGNLFAQTEYVEHHRALLSTRRPRSENEHPPWLVHAMLVQGEETGTISYETNRTEFIGRGRSLVAPQAMLRPGPLGNSIGSVLDPIVAFRRTITLAPNDSARIDILTGIASRRETALALAEKYDSPPMRDRLVDLAWTHSQVTLRQLDATEADAQLYGRMASALVYVDPSLRASAGVLRGNRRGQSGLWSYGISGDLPIVLLRVRDVARVDIVRRLLQAHSYWRLKGLVVELVILNEDASVYRQSLHDHIIGMIGAGMEAPLLDKPGGIFVRQRDQIPPDDLILLQSVARLSLTGDAGRLEQQVSGHGKVDKLPPHLRRKRSPTDMPASALPVRDLILFNGWGGFTRDGREYVMTLDPDQPDGAASAMPGQAQRHPHATPAPWSNVLSNPSFGTLITESGGGYTWYENSHEYRLTPWSNDPVTDPPGECFYVRDDETGLFWSPTPAPVHGATPYVIRHGFGYSVFEHDESGIFSELTVYVAMDMPVKFSTLRLQNHSGRPRRLSVMSCHEWVLGEHRSKNAPHIQTEVHGATGGIVARNFFNDEFSGHVAFAQVNMPEHSLTADRTEFLGRNGTPANPSALHRVRLSGRTGAGLDPCAAFHVAAPLEPGQETQITFCLGAASSPTEAQSLMERCGRPHESRAALEGVWNYWNRTLGAVHVETPDPAVNVLVNGWLVYQVISARMWGRTGFYQSGGAYGFRDQLQDAMALVHAQPGLLREHLLRAAARQFREGDVQHWWHPPSGRGVRTKFSDDFLWLPYAACRYVGCVNDTGVLDENIPFLEGRPCRPDEESYYELPHLSDESATLYQHCVRAIENGLKFGRHGLPLIGCGDWNDGFNLIGTEGRGESVWLAFFLCDVLTRFADLARRRNDTAFAEKCRTEAARIRQAIEEHCWDGEWYLRAFFDDGTPLGSHANEECQIDALPQSWSVLTGVGDPERAARAMEAVGRRLIRADAKLIQLFDPPFDKSPLNPGYIKGYVPGVRENGGQYTHAAIWTVMAFALNGHTEEAWELFSMINPVNHGKTREGIETYRVEPYVVAADVYGVPPHTGRGGWTWYTGSAGWMYRLTVETMLGIQLIENRLRIEPRLPKSWPQITCHYRYRETFYHIHITRVTEGDDGTTKVTLDGEPIHEDVPLADDRRDHHIQIELS